jgi:hypothetical protein
MMMADETPTHQEVLALLERLRSATRVCVSRHRPVRDVGSQGDGFRRFEVGGPDIHVVEATHGHTRVFGMGTTRAIALDDFLAEWPDQSDPVVREAIETRAAAARKTA